MAYVFAEVHQTKAVHQKEDAERNYQATEEHPDPTRPGPPMPGIITAVSVPLLSYSKISAVPMRYYDACQ